MGEAGQYEISGSSTFEGHGTGIFLYLVNSEHQDLDFAVELENAIDIETADYFQKMNIQLFQQNLTNITTPHIYNFTKCDLTQNEATLPNFIQNN